ncbi:MBL fold metallo-hydrolase [Sorangium cellulosum]|uniref:MBL fold metallo-hydrolase n=1 Tax=Sorangium cellulosum TaxID=56 RepID=A0A150PR10_SORCE|nr:MBL fold metallo-hydrolase [Sorangium cellulosum]
MGQWRYEQGLHDVGNGSFAYLQPAGTWGLSNAGLVTSDGEALLVDTLFDLKRTREMLDAMRAATPAAARIGTVVNTHANGDHCYGNALVDGATIVATRASAAEMDEVPAPVLAAIMRQARSGAAGPLGDYLLHCFGAFDFDGIAPAAPTRVFDGELTLSVGSKEVRLLEVGPTHTKGDLLVHVPADRVIYTGDILFIEVTPIMWEGPVGNWIKACDAILATDVDVIVPGHGPLTDQDGVRAVRDYLVYIRDEARRRYDAGMSPADAARDIALGDYARWSDAERIAVNVHTLYREFSGGKLAPPGLLEIFGLMAELARRPR